MNYVAYYRVSTARQGATGLGLDAQRLAVSQFCQQNLGSVTAEFVEVESGGKNSRPRLEAAMKACRIHGATLIIAKLDRLARNVHFISGLMEAGVDFVAVDNPHANRLMLHLLAAFAEHERDQISKRTKEALAAAKARGVKLGANGSNLARRNRIKAETFTRSLIPILDEIASAGSLSLRAIAQELERREVPSPGGCQWYPATVQRLLTRANRLRCPA